MKLPLLSVDFDPKIKFTESSCVRVLLVRDSGSSWTTVSHDYTVRGGVILVHRWRCLCLVGRGNAYPSTTKLPLLSVDSDPKLSRPKSSCVRVLLVRDSGSSRTTVPTVMPLEAVSSSYIQVARQCSW
jgi:hypothetical protein